MRDVERRPAHPILHDLPVQPVTQHRRKCREHQLHRLDHLGLDRRRHGLLAIVEVVRRPIEGLLDLQLSGLNRRLQQRSFFQPDMELARRAGRAVCEMTLAAMPIERFGGRVHQALAKPARSEHVVQYQQLELLARFEVHEAVKRRAQVIGKLPCRGIRQLTSSTFA